MPVNSPNTALPLSWEPSGLWGGKGQRIEGGGNGVTEMFIEVVTKVWKQPSFNINISGVTRIPKGFPSSALTLFP